MNGKLSRREAASTLVQAYALQKPRDGVRYPEHAIRLPAAKWAEIIEALRPLASA